MTKRRYAVPKGLLAGTVFLASLLAVVTVTAQGLPEGIGLLFHMPARPTPPSCASMPGPPARS